MGRKVGAAVPSPSFIIGCRTRAFQQAVDEVRTLPLSLPKCGSKANFSFFE